MSNEPPPDSDPSGRNPADLTSPGRSAIQLGLTLRLDALSVQAISALEAIGLEPVLIKGPATAHHLYHDDPGARPYTDVDLAVDPQEFDRAASALTAVGFVAADEGRSPTGKPRHAETYIHPRSGVSVDLHRGFHTIALVDRWWSLLLAHSESLEILGKHVRIPDLVSTAMISVLHERGWLRTANLTEDIRRTIVALSEDQWDEVAARARECDCLDAIWNELADHPGGAAIADRLNPARTVRMDGSLRRDYKNSGSLIDGYALKAAERFSAAHGIRERLHVMLYFLFPPAKVLEARYPWIRGRTHALIAARILRPFAAIYHSPAVTRKLITTARTNKRRRQLRSRSL